MQIAKGAQAICAAMWRARLAFRSISPATPTNPIDKVSRARWASNQIKHCACPMPRRKQPPRSTAGAGAAAGPAASFHRRHAAPLLPSLDLHRQRHPQLHHPLHHAPQLLRARAGGVPGSRWRLNGWQ